MESIMIAEVREAPRGKIAFVRKAGLSIATVSLIPLIAFAVLWTSLLLLLGGLWVGNALGFL